MAWTRITLSAPCCAQPRIEDSRSAQPRPMAWDIAFHPQSQHALPDTVIRVGGDEDRWDSLPCFDQMFVKLDARHIWHMNIRDQAICDREFGGRKKFGGGREHGNGVVQRLEQPAH